MFGVCYPGLQDHKADHLRLLLDAENFVMSLGNVLTALDRVAIVSHFDNWLARHKAGYDLELWAFMNGQARLPTSKH